MSPTPARTGKPPNNQPASGVPARGYTNPPLQPGHTLSTKHGSHSPRVYLPLAQELTEGLLDARPDLAPYPVAVARWAEWEARALLMRRHMAQVGDLDGTGPEAEHRKVTAWLTQCENSAERAAAVLGLDPFSEARLATARAGATLLSVDMEGIAKRGREIIRDRVRSGDWTEPADPAGELLAQVTERGREAWADAVREHGGDDRHESARGQDETG